MEIAIKKASREDAPIIARAVAMAIGEESVAEYCGENYLAVLEEVACAEGNVFENCSLWVVPLCGGLPFPAVAADVECPLVPVGRKDGRL